MFLKQVQCPNCDSIKSWKILYSGNEESALWAVGRNHSTRCQECQCVFEYTATLITKRDRLRRKRQSVIATNIKAVEPDGS